VIFISDGEANAPDPVGTDSSEMKRFIQGTAIPTTFTIFFSNNDSVPSTIEAMTSNIKANNYSINNDQSEAWPYTNTGEDELMQFIMKNVISVISKTTKADVKKITINGTSGQSSWNGMKVQFSEMFPLTGMKTPFTYDISYLIEDTVVIDGIKSVKTLDTTLTTNFSAEIKNGTMLTEPLSIEYWERSLGFFHGTDSLNTLTASISTPELRFSTSALCLFERGHFHPIT